VKGARTVILLETMVLIMVVVSAGSLYSRVKAEADAKDRQIAQLQKEHHDLLMRYNDVNWQFNELSQQVASASADQQPSASPQDELRQQLEYERRQYKELEDAFERLAAQLDEYVQRAEAQDSAVSDRDSGRRQGRGRRSDFRRMGNEFIDGRIEDLQKRIDSTDDPAEQDKLVELGNAIQDMRDLRERIRTAESDEEREQAVRELSGLREQFRELVSDDSRRGGGRRGGRRDSVLSGREQNP